MTKLFELSFINKWKLHDIVLKQIEGNRDFPSYIQAMIEKEWAIVSKNNPHIYDGECYSLIDAEILNNLLICSVQECSYRDFIGTNIKNIEKIKDTSLLANALAACVIIKTADDCIVVGKRSELLAENKSEWHIIGGTLESKDNKPESPFELIIKEINEELGVPEKHVQNLHCIGMGRAFHNYKPEFLMACDTSLSNSQVANLYQNASHKYEHDCIEFIKPADINQFVMKNRFSPIGLAALACAGIYKIEGM
ncbi:MAG TPA: NUDIX hydrolase [Candidatus Cloacimonadota bacterium]|jgi:hypothetical protein|nr:NUDIX hydrolase [Candidatus Cloacimonadales bacterium]HPY95696.1 NUDIX hydrolase [Candidatus Cloacimonadota bacterium]HQB40368.1 NUDIX hydrolase [Candidatus Cloacimonadota bacterium]